MTENGEVFSLMTENVGKVIEVLNNFCYPRNFDHKEAHLILPSQ